MGTMQHHAIIVTGSDTYVKKAFSQAEAIFPSGQLSPICGPVVNSYFSFAVFPDGSKEYWSNSDLGDQQREDFLEYLRKNSGTYYCEVAWGELGNAVRQ